MRRTEMIGRFARQNALALAALFFVVGGGGAIAASQGSGPGRNSVDAKAIKTDAVGEKEIQKNAVGEKEIQKNAVAEKEIRSAGVGSAEIADGSIALGDLAFQVPQRGDVALRGGSSTMKLTLEGFDFVAAATEQFNVPADSGALVLGQVTLTDSDDGSDSEVEVRVVHNGHVEQDLVFADTLADGISRTVPVSIGCDLVPAGQNTISLEVRKADGPSTVSVGPRSLEIVQFGPIFHPPG
jgi:hypothetical protein